MSTARKTIVREMRGIPYFMLYEYLEDMGGKPVSEDMVRAADWEVRLERMKPFRIGSLEVGQTRLVIEIEEDAEAEFNRVFAMKTFRAGG